MVLSLNKKYVYISLILNFLCIFEHFFEKLQKDAIQHLKPNNNIYHS